MATLKEHLYAVQAALDRSYFNDHKFEADVFPFDSQVRQSTVYCDLQVRQNKAVVFVY